MQRPSRRKKTFAPIAGRRGAAGGEARSGPDRPQKKAKHHETVGSLPEGRTVTSITLSPNAATFDSAERYVQVLATATLDDGNHQPMSPDS